MCTGQESGVPHSLCLCSFFQTFCYAMAYNGVRTGHSDHGVGGTLASFGATFLAAITARELAALALCGWLGYPTLDQGSRLSCGGEKPTFGSFPCFLWWWGLGSGLWNAFQDQFCFPVHPTISSQISRSYHAAGTVYWSGLAPRVGMAGDLLRPGGLQGVLP